MSHLRPLSAPGGHWLTGHLSNLRHDFLGLLTSLAQEHGDCVAFRLGHRQAVLLNHPDLIEQVLISDGRHFIKHFGLRVFRPLIGNGLATSEGSFWLRQRRLAQPGFHRDHMAGYADVMIAGVARMLKTWQDGETRDLHAEMVGLTMGIASRIFFGADVASDAAEVDEAFRDALACFDHRFRSLLPLPLWLPTPGNVRLRRAIRRLERVISRFVAQRRSGDAGRVDLLSLLLRARDEEDGRGMTDQQLRDEVMTMFVGGHETTALALTWALYLLSRHPNAEARLLTELGEVLSGRRPSAADLPRLPFAEQVVLEAMRLYPPAYVIGRQPLRDCEIGRYRIAKGTTVFMSQWVTHRDERFFVNAEAFEPDRWADGLARRLPKGVYFPFGAGPRVCIGNTFAMMEATLLLAAVVQRFRVTLVPNPPVIPWPSLTLRPKHGIRVVVGRR